MKNKNPVPLKNNVGIILTKDKIIAYNICNNHNNYSI